MASMIASLGNEQQQFSPSVRFLVEQLGGIADHIENGSSTVTRAQFLYSRIDGRRIGSEVTHQVDVLVEFDQRHSHICLIEDGIQQGVQATHPRKLALGSPSGLNGYHYRNRFRFNGLVQVNGFGNSIVLDDEVLRL